VTAGLAGLGAILFTLLMVLGDYRVPLPDLVASLLRLREDGGIDFVVLDLRLPLALAAVGVGLALGIAGSVFQKLLGNPLASPDFVGVSSGASLFAVTSIVLLGLSGLQVSAAALAGSFVAAAAIYLLAWRGGVQGYRFILTGVGVSQFCVSVIGYVVARSDIYEAREAMTWLVGSVGRSGPVELRVLWATLAVAIPLAVLLERPLRTLELGDDTAHALGACVELSRLLLLVLSIVLVGVATAVAGPILFVALLAGPIAQRLLGPASSSGLLASALVGAVIVMAAELMSAHLLPVSLPTGVISGAVGAPYLIWLLATANREGRGG
jgi:iron complex transport system permease protein